MRARKTTPLLARDAARASRSNRAHARGMAPGGEPVGKANVGYGELGKTFAVGLGCDFRHASRLIYSRGLDLAAPTSATPIGAGCKVCEGIECPQRAFPPISRAVAVDQNRSTRAPFPVA